VNLVTNMLLFGHGVLKVTLQVFILTYYCT
jgi:hypothetical protein